VAEAERRDPSTPKVKPEYEALTWIAYRDTPLELPRLDNPSRELENLLQRFEEPPPGQINEEYASARRDLLAFYWFDHLLRTAAGDEMLVQLKADKLAYFTRPADDPFAEFKRGHPSSWGDIQHWSQVPRPTRLVRLRIIRDDRQRIDREFFFDEPQLLKLFPVGKRLMLPRDELARFVKGYADDHPGMGADPLRNRLPEAIRRQIPRKLFRLLMPDPKERKGGRPQKPRQ